MQQERLNDICIHVKKQGLDINPVRMYEAFYKQHKDFHGTNRNKYGHEYYNSMQQRYDWVENQIWDVIESKIISNNYERVMRKYYDHIKPKFIPRIIK